MEPDTGILATRAPARPPATPDRDLRPEHGSRRLDCSTTTKGADQAWIDHDARRWKRKAGIITDAFLLRQTIERQEPPAGYAQHQFLTLTLAPTTPWRAQLINDFRRALRDWLRRQGWTLYGIFVAELGETTGRLHYHVMLHLPTAARLTLARIRAAWPHGFIKRRILTDDNLVGYLAKYAAKAQAAELARRYPKGLRITGTWGLDIEAKQQRRHKALPADLKTKHQLAPADDLRPTPGGGRTSRTTGTHYPSEWIQNGMDQGRMHLVRKDSPAGHALLALKAQHAQLHAAAIRNAITEGT
jgi:hypothetical protein